MEKSRRYSKILKRIIFQLYESKDIKTFLKVIKENIDTNFISTFSLTVEPTASFWDAGEYISTSAKLQIGHPPGAPFYQMMGAFFSLFADGNENIALMVNFNIFCRFLWVLNF